MLVIAVFVQLATIAQHKDLQHQLYVQLVNSVQKALLEDQTVH
jgi:hypothetical protein